MNQCQSGDVVVRFKVDQSLSRKSTCGVVIGVTVRGDHISRNYIADVSCLEPSLMRIENCSVHAELPTAIVLLYTFFGIVDCFSDEYLISMR